MRLDAGTLSIGDVRRRFDAAAAGFDQASYLHRATCDGLIERLAPVTVEAGLIVDLGSATGEGSRQLRRSYRGARILSVDLSLAMLRMAGAKRRWFSAHDEILADAQHLPFVDGCVDLVFANMLLPWIPDPAPLFEEVTRVLKTGGVFTFATLGPDSMSEIRDVFRSSGRGDRVHTFADMHDIGDALVRAGLADPVLDVDRLTVTFSDAGKLVADFESCGASLGLTETVFADQDDALSLDLELVYGHAWGTGPRQPAGEFRVDPGAIGRIRRR